jgi:MYXO-CTERM domain-containing protein
MAQSGRREAAWALFLAFAIVTRRRRSRC